MPVRRREWPGELGKSDGRNGAAGRVGGGEQRRFLGPARCGQEGEGSGAPAGQGRQGCSAVTHPPRAPRPGVSAARTLTQTDGWAGGRRGALGPRRRIAQPPPPPRTGRGAGPAADKGAVRRAGAGGPRQQHERGRPGSCCGRGPRRGPRPGGSGLRLPALRASRLPPQQLRAPSRGPEQPGRGRALEAALLGADLRHG